MSEHTPCAHCGTPFTPSGRKLRRARNGQPVYCNRTCANRGMGRLKLKPVPRQGACRQCGGGVYARTPKPYCSLGCYRASAQYAATLGANHQRRGAPTHCLQCAKPFYARPAQQRKFCCRPCYRSYMAARFDRWAANPAAVVLPDSYDAFLDRDTLECLLEGCTWSGKFLSMHLNLHHGIPVQEFKRMAGFNLKTGLVSRDIARALATRANETLAAHPHILEALLLAPKRGGPHGYRSKEREEHYRKAMALRYP